MNQFDYLDEITRDLQQNDDRRFGVLSTGEKLYVALAANRHDLLKELDYTVVQAMARLEGQWLQELVARWQYN